MKIKTFFLAIILSFAILFSSCSTPQAANNEYYGGEAMNAEILSEIAESIFAESESKENSTSNETTHDNETTEKREHDGVYYWTESGGVYHMWSDCGHLKNSQNIESGSKDDAILDGKEKLCSSCEKKS